MVSVPDASIETLADLLSRLGDVDPARVRFHPAPGTATERDIRDVHTREGCLCELVDKTLVEKAMGFRESCPEIQRPFVWQICFLKIYSSCCASKTPDPVFAPPPGQVDAPHM